MEPISLFLTDTVHNLYRHLTDTVQTLTRHRTDTVQTPYRNHTDTVQILYRQHTDAVQTKEYEMFHTGSIKDLTGFVGGPPGVF